VNRFALKMELNVYSDTSTQQDAEIQQSVCIFDKHSNFII
jgi:hypothetical protein